MRSTVFTDGALGRQAGRFVWLAWDTEKAQNLALKAKYPVPALPTYLVVDPATETPILRWVGGATVPQLQKILDDGSRALQKKTTSGLEARLAGADRLYAAGNDKEAAAAYRAILAGAPRGWKPWGRAAESLLFALQRTADNESCAATAHEAWARLKRTPSAANVAAVGLGCALDLKPEDPKRAPAVAEFAAACREAIADATTPIADDDRAAAYAALMDEREAAKDPAGRKEIAGRLAGFLDQQSARAKSADERASLDSWRVNAALVLGSPERAIPALQRSEKDLPADYNPPARLAVLLSAAGRHDEALAASDRALEKAYGPRRLLVLRNRVDVYKAKGDVAGARRTLEEAIAFAEALPEGQRSDRTIAALRKRLEETTETKETK